jgi:hypothetical protein
MGLDLEVLQQKVRRVAAVDLDAADFCGGERHHRGLVLLANQASTAGPSSKSSSEQLGVSRWW